LITDGKGKFHEHLEYFPYGETWVQEKVSEDAESTPYKFTGKEYDSETGLYYYGAEGVRFFV
jgi:RHS repeat-associated protein